MFGVQMGWESIPGPGSTSTLQETTGIFDEASRRGGGGRNRCSELKGLSRVKVRGLW
jgi:hypothetical protein